MFYGLNPKPSGDVDAVAFMNNSNRRGMTPAVLADARKRGANVLDAWRVRSDKYPDGLLPTLYAREGWSIASVSPYDLQYGAPDEALKAAWRKQGWRDGDPLPDVVYMRPPGEAGRPVQSPDTSAGAIASLDTSGATGQSSRPSSARGLPSPQISTLSAVVAPSAAVAIPDDPDSDWDEAARAGLMGAGAAALGMAGAKALKNNGWKPVKQIEGGGFEKFTETGQRGFQFRPIDQAARARLESFKPGAHFSFAKLPLTARPTAIYKAITAPGSTGYSVHPGTGQLVKGGEPGPRMVGIFPNSSQRTAVIPLAKFRPMDVEKFMLKNRAEFAKDHTLFVGGWQSQIDGVPHVFLDVSRAVDNSRIATKIGELQNPGGKLRSGKVVPPKAGEVQITRKPDGTWPKAQEEIFEPENFKPAEGDYGGRVVGNDAEFIGSPDFQQRVHEMAGVGRVLMNDGNWWDIRGGPFERVYGPEMIEKVAGYTASTSPQNPPRPNLRMATELIRRDIKGEPVHDPNWRAPSDAMGEGFSPGPGMPMPAPDTWKNNATKVREGRPETMFDDKVNDMFHAMIGKLVGVFDRHWAKLAEDPARGIYTDKVINRIQGSMKSGVLEAYPLIENAVRNAAKQAGVDVARYSAWAWEGIRHTIKTTGKLYGQSHPAGAIPEGNEGFNEIFEQLLSEKAAHMKISVAELEGRLRRGEASLLTALLATPVGAAAYSRWRDSGQSNPEGGGS